MMAGVSINTNARAPRRTTLRRRQSNCEYQSLIIFSFQTKVTRHEKTSHGSLINHRRISRRPNCNSEYWLGSRRKFCKKYSLGVWNTAKPYVICRRSTKVRDAEIKWDVDCSADTDRGGS